MKIFLSVLSFHFCGPEQWAVITELAGSNKYALCTGWFEDARWLTLQLCLGLVQL